MCTGAWVARRRERAEQTEKALEYHDIESVRVLQLGQQRTERVQEKVMIFCTTGILKLTANRVHKMDSCAIPDDLSMAVAVILP